MGCYTQILAIIDVVGLHIEGVVGATVTDGQLIRRNRNSGISIFDINNQIINIQFIHVAV